jgi:Na+/H+-dicarboxylate symporters
MEHLGASKSVVGLVIPTGYSFNLDGTNIYMTLATLFLAQATNTPLTISQELGILVIAMITRRARPASPARASSRSPPRFLSYPTSRCSRSPSFSASTSS